MSRRSSTPLVPSTRRLQRRRRTTRTRGRSHGARSRHKDTRGSFQPIHLFTTPSLFMFPPPTPNTVIFACFFFCFCFFILFPCPFPICLCVLFRPLSPILLLCFNPPFSCAAHPLLPLSRRFFACVPHAFLLVNALFVVFFSPILLIHLRFPPFPPCWVQPKLARFFPLRLLVL